MSASDQRLKVQRKEEVPSSLFYVMMSADFARSSGSLMALLLFYKRSDVINEK